MRTILPIDLEMLSYDEEKSQISTATSITTDSDESSDMRNRLKTGWTNNNNIFSNAIHHLIFDSLKKGICHLNDNVKGSLLRISNKSEQPNSDGEALIDGQIGDDMAKKNELERGFTCLEKVSRRISAIRECCRPTYGGNFTKQNWHCILYPRFIIFLS